MALTLSPRLAIAFMVLIAVVVGLTDRWPAAGWLFVVALTAVTAAIGWFDGRRLSVAPHRAR